MVRGPNDSGRLNSCGIDDWREDVFWGLFELFLSITILFNENICGKNNLCLNSWYVVRSKEFLVQNSDKVSL